MTNETPFDEAERRELTALGLDISGTNAHTCGMMCVDAIKWGYYHLKLTITLPGGSEISGFVPRSKIVPPPGDGD